MPLWLQHSLIFVLVSGCIFLLARQALAAFSGRRSRIGQCCSKGCADTKVDTKLSEPNTEQPIAAPEQKVAFFPSEWLIKRK